MKQISFTLVLLALCAVSVFGGKNPDIIKIPGGISGQGTTTRYWDCCKPSCSWVENIKTPTMTPVNSCAIDGNTVVNASAPSGCLDEGEAFMCSNQQPWVINDTLAYGFAAASFTGGADTNLCCACLLLTFGGQLQGKQMVVQNTNTGGDLGQNQFDMALPGGGVGIFWQGCDAQWKAGQNGWGDRYGGVPNIEACSQLPEVLQPGCKFRFQFYAGADNPPVTFEQVKCPDEIVALSGCEL